MQTIIEANIIEYTQTSIINTQTNQTNNYAKSCLRDKIKLFMRRIRVYFKVEAQNELFF